ncbi:MAG: polyprenyl synthetase family protein [Candidatus Bathyarchaeia archaeon]
MDIEKLLGKQAAAIDKAIEKYIPRKMDKNAVVFKLSPPKCSYNLDALNKAITEPVWEFLDRGGKRWRPGLFLLICEAFGKNPEDFLEYAIIPEVIHNGTLMVDDIEDQSEKRRGRPCTYRLFGLDIAINAGNAMYYLPLLSLVKNRNKIPASTLNKAYEIYVQEMVNLSFGQAMDIAWHRGLADADTISEQDYMQMCAYKTGTLARIAAKLAATLSGADDELTDRLGDFAEAIGIAFQIQDDILDLTGGEFAEKKGARGMDISEGKRSLMVIRTLQQAKQADRKRLLEILGAHTDEQKLRDEAIAIIVKHGAIEYAGEYARRIVRESWSKVDPLLPASGAKEKLRAFADYLVERRI